jgi:hypothetical protein
MMHLTGDSGGSPSRPRRVRNLAEDEYWRALVACDLCGMRVQRGRIIQHQTTGKCNPQVAAMIAADSIDTAWHQVDFAKLNTVDDIEHVTADSESPSGAASTGAAVSGANGSTSGVVKPALAGLQVGSGSGGVAVGAVRATASGTDSESQAGVTVLPVPESQGSSTDPGNPVSSTGSAVTAVTGSALELQLASGSAGSVGHSMPAAGTGPLQFPVGHGPDTSTASGSVSGSVSGFNGVYGSASAKSKLEALASSMHSGRLAGAAQAATSAGLQLEVGGSLTAAAAVAQAGHGSASIGAPSTAAELLAAMHGTRDTLASMSWGTTSATGSTGPGAQAATVSLQTLAMMHHDGHGGAAGGVAGGPLGGASQPEVPQASAGLGGAGAGTGQSSDSGSQLAGHPSAQPGASESTGAQSDVTGGPSLQGAGPHAEATSGASIEGSSVPPGPVDISLFVAPQVSAYLQPRCPCQWV